MQLGLFLKVNYTLAFYGYLKLCFSSYLNI